jgi:hypothetical protein
VTDGDFILAKLELIQDRYIIKLEIERDRLSNDCSKVLCSERERERENDPSTNIVVIYLFYLRL